MRPARILHSLRNVVWGLLAVGLAGCSGDDAPVNAIGSVQGVFKDADGHPIANAPVTLTLSDTAGTTELASRALTTSAAGQFNSAFDFSPETFPVKVRLAATPPVGSGMGDVFLFDSLLALEPGRSTGTLTYALNAEQIEPSVNGIPAAPFAQDALLGNYWGATVPPYGAPYYIVVLLYLEITGTTGSVTGRYDIDYSVPVATPDGSILGAVLLDTLRLEFTGDTVPGEARRVASFKATATSSTADTLIAWPDPCTPECWLNTAPLRLVRTP